MEANEFSDVHLHFRYITNGDLEFNFEGSLIFPGPRRPTDNDTALLMSLADSVKDIDKSSFFVEAAPPFNYLFRVESSAQAVDGVWYRLRKTLQERPYLETLGAKLPENTVKKMLSPELSNGGLILICGQPGAGKTTTASALISSRLKKYGGMAWTVEDPPEILSLNGWHDKGYCTQTAVCDGEDGWERSIQVLLRSQPVSSRLILFVGEIRTQQAAQMVIRAASNGFLVITTSFATDIIGGIEAICHIAGPQQTDYLAAVLRCVLYQKLTLRPELFLQSDFLMSENSGSRMAQLIRAQQFGQLKDELLFQSA